MIADTDNSKSAVVWIRDGVLIDRMYINPVAFAFASWRFVSPVMQTHGALEELINFGFEKSGFSCAEKAELFNKERRRIIRDPQAVQGVYDAIAAKAAESAEYFPAAIKLCATLQMNGVSQFITSSISQETMDTWMRNDPKGRAISPLLCEALGSRPGFKKGEDHFAHIVRKYGVGRIFYVADALSEIRTGRALSGAYHIVPIGYAHAVTVTDVLRGVELVRRAIEQHTEVPAALPTIDPGKISLQSKEEVIYSLRQAGADIVVSGGKEGSIMQNLCSYFREAGLLK